MMTEVKKHISAKKCAVFNFWWADGHGAALTAFALSVLLKELGYMPCLIKTTFGISGEECEKGRNYKFISKYVDCTRKNYLTVKDYRSLNAQYDNFIVGSDQVFRVEWVLEKWFLYPFKYKKNLIAMAASFGTNVINSSQSKIRRIRYYLSRFNAISLREKDGPEVFKKYFGNRQDLEVILDPVFLIEKKVYDQIILEAVKEKHFQEKEDFIFFYILDINDQIKLLAKKIEKLYNMKVIWETSEVQVEEFLFLIKNSKMVITDSFHGLCFSVIFNVPFYCIYNELRGMSRINSLIEILHLNVKQFLYYGELENCSYQIPLTDFSKTNSIIEKEREKGRKWIENCLKNPISKPKKIELVDRISICWFKKGGKIINWLQKYWERLKKISKKTGFDIQGDK